MKFIHLADLHLGKTVNEFNMIEDQRFLLKQITETVKKEEIDAVLIAGDIYDLKVPSEEAVRLFDEFITGLFVLEKSVFLIPGNHDSDERLGFGSAIFEKNNMFFCPGYDGKLFKKTIEDEYGPVNFYLLPFVKASQVRYYHPNEKIENYERAVQTALSTADIDKDQRNVILAHQYVFGKGGNVELSGSEGPGTLNVGSVERIGYDCFDDFDYVALGHIHKAQRVGREEVRYSGSLLKYHANEATDKKSIPVVTLGKKGEVDIKLESFRPRRDLRKIKGKLKEIMSPDNINDTDDYVYVTLTDEDPVDNAIDILRSVYPNTLHIDYDNTHTRYLQGAHLFDTAHKKSFTELISEFYKGVYGSDIDDKEMSILKEVAQKVGIINETDQA